MGERGFGRIEMRIILLSGVASLVLIGTAIAADKPPTIRPCTATVTTDCKVIPPLDPNQRASQAQPQVQVRPEDGDPGQAQTPPGPPPPAPPMPSYGPPKGIYGPGFYVGPEGFSIFGFTVRNPNYIPPPPVVVQPPPPPPPGYAPEAPQPPLGWVNGPYLSCGPEGCVVNVTVSGINVRQFPDGPIVVAALVNGTPVSVVTQSGGWVQIVPNCALGPTGLWSGTTGVPLLGCGGN
jgi:hypothetical protein